MLRLLLLVSLLMFSSLSLAHNVVAGAYVDGMMIEGEIGLSNGEMAQAGVLVEVFDANNNKLGETKLAEEGLFTYQAKKAQTHIIKANLGAGHIAEITVEASEFSASAETKPTTKTSTTKSNAKASLSLSEQDLERIVRKAVSQQVKPLQRELRAYKEKVFFRDILGGLGFIFGMVGVAMYFAAKRKEQANASVP